MYKKVKIFVIVLCLSISKGLAQDPQFSQFYASPLYLNPAFAGSAEWARVGLNYRNQWPSIDANFNSIVAWADLYIEDKNSGLGIVLSQDTQGILTLRSTSIALQYAYDLRLTHRMSLRSGFQGAFYNRSLNFSNLIFGDQFDPNTGNLKPGYVSHDANSGNSIFFADISLGGLLYTKNAWIGVSASHVNRPNQSLLGNTDRLAMKISAHAGIKLFFSPGVINQGFYSRERERSFSPSIQFRHQGSFDQLDLGTYFTFDPLIVGLWYRGLPFPKLNLPANHESLVTLIGITKRTKTDIFNIGYSYDFTISSLGLGSGGAHEISLTYSWNTRDPRKPPKDKLSIPCPNF